MKKKNSFDISIWEAGLKAKEEQLEAERKKILKQLDSQLISLSKKYDWEKVYILGSIIDKKRFSQVSDIDIAILGLNKFLHYKFLAELSIDLDREVDVIRMEDCYFSESIQKRGVLWIPKKIYF